MTVLAHLGVLAAAGEVSSQRLLEDFAADGLGDVADFTTGQETWRSRSCETTSLALGSQGAVRSVG